MRVEKQNGVVYNGSIIMKSKLAQTIMEKLHASYISVTDDSHHHAGHHGINQVGNTHFSMIIVSKRFEGQSSLQRHRCVNQMVAPFYENGLHALKLTTKTPGEWNGK